MKAGSFDEQATQHQIAWRRDNITGSEMGWHDGKQYEWILPRDRWEEGLWPSIRTGTSSALTSYLETNRVQKHRSSGNLKSSWMLRANFYFPFRDTERGRELLAGFLREKVHPDIASLESLELEYEAPGELAPQVLLGETGGRRGAVASVDARKSWCIEQMQHSRFISAAAACDVRKRDPRRLSVVELMLRQRTDTWRGRPVRPQRVNDVVRFGKGARHSVILRELSTAPSQPTRN